MPLLRRRAAASDAEMRRHSFFPTDSNTLNPILDSDLPDGRASEQMPRRPSPGEFHSTAEPETTLAPLPMLNRPSTDYPKALERSGTPPIQEETSKHRRFYMLRFRHASDSQLSTRSRLQAQNASIAADAPPMPQRKYSPLKSSWHDADHIPNSPRDHHHGSDDGFQWRTSNKKEVERETAGPYQDLRGQQSSGATRASTTTRRTIAPRYPPHRTALEKGKEEDNVGIRTVQQ